MIGHLSGTVVAVELDHLILSAGGVGYKLFSTQETLAGLQTGVATELWTHLAVRENALDLYGFATREALHFFELLLSVSGIGPRSALSVLGIAQVETLRAAIASGDPGYLTKVAGIGKKTAEKIVLELSGKVGVASEEASAARQGDEDALAALTGMGYTVAEAREALRAVPRDIADSGERLRAALKSLGS